MDISIIIPVFNGEETINQVIASLLNQEYDGKIEIIIINDNSNDKTPELLKKYENDERFKIINNKKNKGLAETYNIGIRNARYDIIVTVHQDCFPTSKDCLQRLIKPLEFKTVVAVCPTLCLPKEIWKKYGFWQKFMFADIAGKEIPALTGKFDAFKKYALFKVGLFDSRTFRSSGEDIDVYMKLLKIGNVRESDIKINHLHGLNSRVNIRYIFKKNMQFGESHGVLFRKYKFSLLKKWQDYVIIVKPLIVIGLFIPYISIVSIVLIMIYSICYSHRIYKIKDYRIASVPFVNFINLFIFSIAFLKGFISEKQKL